MLQYIAIAIGVSTGLALVLAGLLYFLTNEFNESEFFMTDDNA